MSKKDKVFLVLVVVGVIGMVGAYFFVYPVNDVLAVALIIPCLAAACFGGGGLVGGHRK